MVFRYSFSGKFHKHFKTLTTQEKRQVMDKLKQLSENPMHPSLRTKHIKGTRGLFECSINMDIRVVWYYEGAEIIVVMDVGHHEILNDYR